MGRVVKQQQSTLTSTYNLSYGYNLASQLVSETYPSNRVISYKYDEGMRLSEVRDASQVYANGYTYATHGGLSSETWNNGGVYSFSYNSRLQPTQIKLSIGGVEKQRYDYLYGVVTQSSGAVDTTKNTGQVARIEGYVNAVRQWQQRFSYDKLGRLDIASEYRGDVLATRVYESNYDYDRWSNRMQVAASNAASLPYWEVKTTDINSTNNRINSLTGATMTYDNRLRIKRWNVQNVLGWDYLYSTASIPENTGRVAFADNLYDATLDRSYDYDQVGRLWAAHSGGEARAHAGIIATWPPADGPYAENWGFDQWGNIVSRNGWGGWNTTYGSTPFANNRMTVNPVTGTAMQYDAAGNLKNDGRETFNYDATGQQTYASTTALTQGYDGDRLRVKRVENGVTTLYVRSSMLGGQVLGELSSTGVLSRSYVYLGGQMLAIQESSQVKWVHQDPVTKSQRLTNSAGAVVSVVDLDPWGAETSRSSQEQLQPHRYTSYERDANGGDEAQQRRYQAWWTRFSQPDPSDASYDLSDPQTFNRYSYVGNDPVNFIDPSGLDDIPNIGNVGNVDVSISFDTPIVDSFFLGLGGMGGGGIDRVVTENAPSRASLRDVDPQPQDTEPQQPPQQDSCPPQVRRRLERMFRYNDIFRAMAASIETDPAFFMALSAKETRWGTSYALRVKNNLFGVGYPRPFRYSSLVSAANSWLRSYGGDVWGAPTMDDFAGELRSGVGRYQRPYNSEDRGYYDSLINDYYNYITRWAEPCGFQF
jgi:RHS repeat-associated protein